MIIIYYQPPCKEDEYTICGITTILIISHCTLEDACTPVHCKKAQKLYPGKPLR